MATHRQGSALPVIKKLTQLSSVCALSLPIWMPQIAWSNESIESINNPSAAELPTVTVNSQSTSPTTEGSDAYTSHATQAGTGLLLSPRETPQSDGRYAAHVWTYVRKEGLPPDSFTMNGFEGQFVLIIPSKQLVAVRLGCSPEEKYFNEVKFFKEIVAAF